MGEATNTATPNTELFGDAFDASPIGIAVETMEGKPLYVNPALCSMLRFTEAELRNKRCLDFSPPEDLQKDWALFQQLGADSIDCYQLEKRYFCGDGSLMWGRLSRSLLNGRDSPLVLAMVEDITEQKRAQDSEHGTFETLDLVTKQMAAGVSRCSRDFRYLWVNQAYADWIQRPLNEIVGRSMVDVLGKEAFAALLPLFNRVLAGEKVHDEHEQNFHGIGRRWVSATITPTFAENGIANGWVAVVLDITERKTAERSLLALNHAMKEQTALLQSSEELLRIFVKNTPAGVAMFDRGMRYLQVSDRWCADYSIDSSHVLGRSHYELFPDMPPLWKEQHRRGLAGETLRAEEDRWDREGGAKWVRWEIRPWKTTDGVVGGILIFAEDITQRKQMEEALSDVTRKLVEAQEKERARIARELHDDINQRLALLSMEVEQLRTNPSEIEPRAQEIRKGLGEISADVQALAHDLHPPRLEYLGAVAGMRSWCKEFANRQKLELDFTTDVRSPLPPEIGVSLFRVLQEALQNAFKHSGGKRVAVQLREDSEVLRLVVRDSGKGFDLETASHGNGLGLTSMRERVRLVNGTLTIDSKPNFGTVIEARVPFETARSRKAAAGELILVPPGASPHYRPARRRNPSPRHRVD